MTDIQVRPRIQTGVALALGFALRLLFITNAARIAGDTLLYGDIAKNWMQFGVYGFTRTATGAIPTLIRLPGYPMFLALCFKLFGIDHYIQVMIVQCLIDLATCLLVAGLARRLFGGRTGLAVLWISALCPFTANYVAAPLTEILTLFCIALAFYGLERWNANGAGWNRWLWIISAALAYAILLRPEQGLLAAVVVPTMLVLAFRSHGVRGSVPILAAVLCVVLPLVPWTTRNWRTFHVFQPLAPRHANDPGETVWTGFPRWYRTWAIEFASTERVYWNWDADQIDIAYVSPRAFDNQEQYNRTAALLTTYNKDSSVTPELDHSFDELARERIEDDPIRYYVALPAARLLNMLLRPRTEMLEVGLEWWRWGRHPWKTIFAAAYGLLNFAYLVLGGLGLWLWRRCGWAGYGALGWSMIAFVLLRCALLLTLDNSEPRYTLEFYPLLEIWAGGLFNRVVTKKEA